MLISEMMSKLDEIKEEYGDLDITHAFRWDLDSGFEDREIYLVTVSPSTEPDINNKVVIM